MKKIIASSLFIGLILVTTIGVYAYEGVLRAVPGQVTGIAQYHNTSNTKCNTIVPAPTPDRLHNVWYYKFYEVVGGSIMKNAELSGWSQNVYINEPDDGHNAAERSCWFGSYK